MQKNSSRCEKHKYNKSDYILDFCALQIKRRRRRRGGGHKIIALGNKLLS